MDMIKNCGYDTEFLTLDNISKYEDVFYTNEDYFIITDGRKATQNDYIETVEYSIDGKSQYNIGFNDNGAPVACLFFFNGYPDAETLWLGLFLVHSDYKRKHIGTEIIKALIASLKDTGIKQIRLSVLGNNTDGFSFWKHIGFSVIDETKSGDVINYTMEYVI